MTTSPALARRSRAVGLAKAALVRGQVLAGAFRGSAPRPGLRILYYHRVSDDRDPLAVTPEAFRRQMDALAASGQRVVDLYEIDDADARARRGGGRAHVRRRLSRRARERPAGDARARLPEHRVRRPGRDRGHDRVPVVRARRHAPDRGLGRAARRGARRPRALRAAHAHAPGADDAHARGGPATRSRARSRRSSDELGRPARLFCYPGGYLLAARGRARARVRAARRADLRVRRQPHAVRRTTSCAGRSSSARTRCGCSARGSQARPTRRRPGAVPAASSAWRRDAPPARHRDARRGGRRSDVRLHAHRRPARALCDRGRRRTGRRARSSMPARRSTCPFTTCATSCATRIPTTTPQPCASCARWRARSRPTSCRSTRRRPACWRGSRSPGSGRRRCSPRTAGRSRAAAARPEPCTPRPSAPSRRSATRSCASRTTTWRSRTSAASSRAASCT